MLILMAGLPGTGKSTMARKLARRTGGHVLDKDAVRQAVFGPDAIEYSRTQDDFVVWLMVQAAGYILGKDPSQHVLLDGRLFSRSYQVDQAIEFADGIHTEWKILECVCSDETARLRIESAHDEGSHPARNRNFGLYLEFKSRFEPITRPKTVINTDQPLEECVKLALSALA